MSPIVQGLLITAIGMGLVFVSILVLWGLMIVLVKVLADKPKKVTVTASAEESMPESIVETVADSGRLQCVAAVAVAVALSMQQQHTSQTIPQETGAISPWQATRRTSILSQSAELSNRKSRGNK